MRRKIPVEQIFPNDAATVEWLKAQKESTMFTYKMPWKRFLQFTDKTGDEILADRKADTEHNWEKRIMAFRNWLIEQDSTRGEVTIRVAIIAVRSFFAFHRSPLSFVRSEREKVNKAKRKTEDYLFSREDLKRMFDVADLEERYVLAAGKSFGLRAGDFLKLTRGDLQPYLERPIPISIGEYVTRKEGVTACPMIDTDAKPIIRLMIEKMDREGQTKPTDRILQFKNEIHLSRILRRLVGRVGIVTGNKVVRFHNLRKFLIDRLSSHMSESKWKQIVGKKISEGAYISAESLREDYARAMIDTTFSKPTLEGDLEMQIKKQAALTVLKSMGISEGEIKSMFAQRGKRQPITPEQEVKLLEGFIEKRRKGDDCEDGKNCGEFKEIPEGEPLGHLRAGYRIVHNLQNGKVIIKR